MGAALPVSFLSPAEDALARAFVDDGVVMFPVEDRDALERIQATIADLAARHLGIAEHGPATAFLDTIHKRVDVVGLNDLRLAVINGLNQAPWVREAYFRLGRRALETIVGNELVMQRRLNLSVQLPDDDSSLLPLHADVWSGDSPFEVVLWTPLVDCRKTKAMFLLPPAANARAEARMADFQGQGVEALYRAIEPELAWCEIQFGQAMIFTQNLMHGNRVNREPETRWSINCRFKSVFSPYSGKRLGEFFEPITLRPATRVGMAYRLPTGFAE